MGGRINRESTLILDKYKLIHSANTHFHICTGEYGSWRERDASLAFRDAAI